MQPQHENKMLDEVEETKKKAKGLLKDLSKLEKEEKRQKLQATVTLPMLDAFGNTKPKEGHGALNRHQRRSARKRARMEGI